MKPTNFLQNLYSTKLITYFGWKRFFLALIVLLNFNVAWSQSPASVTWALTASNAQAPSGNVLAAAQTKGTEIGSLSFGTNGCYNSGTITINWSNASLSANAYYEYAIYPSSSYDLTINDISFYYSVSSSVSLSFVVYYSLDNFASSYQIGSTVSGVSNTTSTVQFLANSLNINVPNGSTCKVRVFAWGATDNTKQFRNKTFVISGTTAAVNTITFNANGGSGAMANQSASSATAINANTFTRTGYSFAGWNTAANGSGTAYANGASFPFTASTTLYAQWTPNTIVFNANGGTGSMANQSASTATAINANTFTRTGYTFAGWNTAANGSGTAYANSASFPFTANTTLYAQWTANTLTVTYNTQGGSLISSGSTSTGGTISSSPGTPTRAGYTFNGWFLSSSGGIAISFPYTHNQTANFTLFAQWSANTITFNNNGGTGSMANQSSSTAAAINANTFTKTCSSFTGWNTAANGSGTAYADGASYPFTANTTLYAQWSVQNQWTGTTNNNWNTASNWSCGTIPAATDNIIIGTGTPVLNTNFTVGASGSLTINGTGALTINPGQKLTLTGAADFGGKLVTVASNASGSGAIVLNGGALTGATNVSLQQWFSAQRAWRMLSNPFSTAITAAAITTNNSSLSVNQSGTGDMVVYTSANDTWAANTTIAANTCYGFFYKGLQSDFNGTPGLSNYSGAGPTATTFTVKGTLNTGLVSVTPNASATYTLVGNPYAAPVNSIALTGGSAAPYYYYQASSASTDIKVKSGAWIAAASNSSNTTTIPMMGLIAYQAPNTNAFSITTAAINTTSSTVASLYKTTAANDQIVVELQKNNTLFDRLIVREEATAGYNTVDANDLLKMENVVANIYALTAKKEHLAVHTEPSFTQAIPLGISAPIGAYQFKITGAIGASDWYLIDNYLHQQIVLNTQTTYSFDVNNDAASAGESRFELAKKMWTTQVGNSALLSSLMLQSNLVQNEIRFVATPTFEKLHYKLLDTRGAILKEGIVNEANQTIAVDQLAAGMYILQVANANKQEVFKIVKQ